jgi:hypothetical protein
MLEQQQTKADESKSGYIGPSEASPGGLGGGFPLGKLDLPPSELWSLKQKKTVYLETLQLT